MTHRRIGHPWRWSLLLALVLALAGAGYRVHQWWPYQGLYQGGSMEAMLRAAATVLISSPGRDMAPSTQVVTLDGAPQLVEDAQEPGLHQLMRQFPPPAEARDPIQSWQTRMSLLRGFVAGLLPAESAVPADPQPWEALELLGENPHKAPYAKRPDALAKLLVQYLAGLGLVGRLVQLEGHQAVEVWRPDQERWEMQDPYYDSEVLHQGHTLSAAQAHDLIAAGMTLDYAGPAKAFTTVLVSPRSNLSGDHLPAWHYLRADHLDLWRVLRVGHNSSPLWRKLASGQKD